MNRVFISAASAIVGGSIVHIADKEKIDTLQKENVELKDKIEKLKYKLNKKNKELNDIINTFDDIKNKQITINTNKDISIENNDNENK